jgi:hypothetical protein
VPYCYYKLVTNVIRAVKIKCCVIPVVYSLAVSQSAFRAGNTQFIIEDIQHVEKRLTG